MSQAPPAAPHVDSATAFDRVHARILRYFPELAAELGGDAAPLMRQVGIAAETIDAAGRSGAGYRQMAALLELAATDLRCADFGMRLARRQSGDMFGPLGLVMKNSQTLGDALDYVSRHSYAHSLAARVWLKRSHSGNAVFVGHDILLDRLPDRSQAMEQLLLIGHLTAMAITGGQARVRSVHFRHLPVSPLKTYRRYFGCEVRFGRNEDGVVFSERDLACPVVRADAQAYASATAFIDTEFAQRRPPLHAQARGVIMQWLATGDCTNQRIAAELNLHPRTLHRRLRTEGTSFLQIKDEVRRDAMLYYSRQTRLDFARISERLGFAEQSVLTRHCQRWFSTTPTAVRAREDKTKD